MHGVPRILTDGEMDSLLAYARDEGRSPGTTSGGSADTRIRRSQVLWLRPDRGFGRLYDRVRREVETINRYAFGFGFGFAIFDFNGAIQLARYSAEDEGFLQLAHGQRRKECGSLDSVSVLLRAPDDHEGGGLNLWYRMRAGSLPQARRYRRFSELRYAPRCSGPLRRALQPGCLNRRAALAPTPGAGGRPVRRGVLAISGGSLSP